MVLKISEKYGIGFHIFPIYIVDLYKRVIKNIFNFSVVITFFGTPLDCML
jgi:hypothetical protein